MNSIIEKKSQFQKYFKQNDTELSSQTFVSVAVWKDFFEFKFKEIQDCLCVFAHSEIGCFLYLPPLGKKCSTDVIDLCFAYMQQHNGPVGITRVENVSFEQLYLFPSEKYNLSRKGYEYCYFKNDIIHLKGNEYKSKRSSYNAFVKNNTFMYQPYDEKCLSECLELYGVWAKERKQKYSSDMYQHMIDENLIVHKWSMENYQKLGLIGRVVRVDGKIKAYSFGYALNSETFCILYEVADASITGLAVYIFREFCRDTYLNPYSFINVMDDSGMENIKKTKLSFHPKILFPIFTATRRNNG